VGLPRLLKTVLDPRIGIVGAGDGSVSVFYWEPSGGLRRATIMPPETLRGHGIRNHPWVYSPFREDAHFGRWRRQPPATRWLIVCPINSRWAQARPFSTV
jgi:hypothetical protein